MLTSPRGRIRRRWRTRRAGGSARARFRIHRRETLRRNRRDWLALLAATAGSGVWVAFADGGSQLVAAGLIGSLATIAAVAWMTGGDVYGLPWLWGSLGERWTAELLDELDDSWRCEHDLDRARGNWDHVVVGPAGVFLIDSKRMSREARVRDDALVGGRLRYSGASFRAAAAALANALEAHIGRRPWVQPVVAIWGDFPEASSEANGVVYLRAEALASWLQAERPRLTNAEARRLAEAVKALRQEGEGWKDKGSPDHPALLAAADE